MSPEEHTRRGESLQFKLQGFKDDEALPKNSADALVWLMRVRRNLKRMGYSADTLEWSEACEGAFEIVLQLEREIREEGY